MIDEIRTSDMLQKLGEWRSSGWSWTKMAEEASKAIGKSVDIQTVKKAYEIAAVRTSEIIAGDEELKGKLSKVVFNQKEQLEKINKVCIDLLDQLSAEGTNTTLEQLAIMREIREQIKLQKDLLDKLTEGFDMKHINKIEYTNVSIGNLTELERLGYIKVIRKPGKPYDPEAKEIVQISTNDLNKLNEDKIVSSGMYCIQVMEDKNE